ncbi:MAG: DUF4426 domain-containing protein [Pseudomonadota bacterium]
MITRTVCGALCLALGAGLVRAEQMQAIGDYEAHYSVVPTLFLKPDVAARYDVVRAPDRALLTVSVLDGEAHPVRAQVSGVVRNLLDQARELSFREVEEGPAVYYLAGVDHDDGEVLRFVVQVTAPDGSDHEVTFQQTMYVEGR